MKELIQWIAELKPEHSWGLFVLSALILALIPFAGILLRMLKIKFSNQKGSVAAFSWRIIPEMNIGAIGEKSYYVTNSERPVIYEGMVVLLCWHVTGAYRVDVHPLGKHLQGNAAYTVLRKGVNRFVLTAHTWEGRITRELNIPAPAVYSLQTLNLSKDPHFGQPDTDLATFPIASAAYIGTAFSKMRAGKLKQWSLRRIYAANKKKNIHTKSLEFQTNLAKEKVLTQSFMESQQLLKTYQFRPDAYNRAMAEQHNQLNETK